jgi:SAM-dependent methyltransferase
MDPGSAREADARAGVSASCARLEEGLRAQGDLDLVTLWHVLEHLPKPLEALDSIRKVVRPGGHLAVGVPDNAGLAARLFGSFWFGSDVPRHCSHFTAETLCAALNRAGWRVLHLRHVTEVSTLAGSVHNLLRLRWCDDQVGKLVRWMVLQGTFFPFDHLLRLLGQGDWLIAIARRDGQALSQKCFEADEASLGRRKP